MSTMSRVLRSGRNVTIVTFARRSSTTQTLADGNHDHRATDQLMQTPGITLYMAPN